MPTPTVIAITVSSGITSPWTVPSDWNPHNNSVWCIGPGGNGGATGGGGGAGGSCGVSTNLALSGTVAFNIGTAGSMVDTWFGSSGALCGAAGNNASGATGGAPGTTSAGGATYLGGTGGSVTGSGGGGAGGGGAAGPRGNGGNGGSVASAAAGAGGGGADGGSAGASPSGSTGGSGGLGNGGGTAGRGGDGTSGSGRTQAGVLEPLYGAGGGGGGGDATHPGGVGGIYGGGGGGSTSTLSTTGADGLIIITYVPLVSAALSLTIASTTSARVRSGVGSKHASALVSSALARVAAACLRHVTVASTKRFGRAVTMKRAKPVTTGVVAHAARTVLRALSITAHAFAARVLRPTVVRRPRSVTVLFQKHEVVKSLAVTMHSTSAMRGVFITRSLSIAAHGVVRVRKTVAGMAYALHVMVLGASLKQVRVRVPTVVHSAVAFAIHRGVLQYLHITGHTSVSIRKAAARAISAAAVLSSVLSKRRAMLSQVGGVVTAMSPAKIGVQHKARYTVHAAFIMQRVVYMRRLRATITSVALRRVVSFVIVVALIGAVLVHVSVRWRRVVVPVSRVSPLKSVRRTLMPAAVHSTVSSAKLPRVLAVVRAFVIHTSVVRRATTVYKNVRVAGFSTLALRKALSRGLSIVARVLVARVIVPDQIAGRLLSFPKGRILRGIKRKRTLVGES